MPSGNSEIILDPKSKTKLVYERSTGDIVFMRRNVERGRITSAGLATLVSSEARGDIMRRGASAWERLAAATSGTFVGGDGTDAVLQTMGGDATLDGAGALTVTDVTVGSDAAGDMLYKSSATALARLAKGSAANVMLMNAGATAPSWAAMSGDVTIAATGATTIGASKVLPSMVEADLIRYVDVQLTNAQMLALNATPITVLGTPGANKSVVVHRMWSWLVATAGAYTNGGGGDVALEFADGTDILVTTVAGYLDSGSDLGRHQAPAVAAAALVANSAVRLFKVTGELGGGNAANSWSVRIWYSIVDMAAFS